ncbi:dUTP diphosphatase [Buchnera aphidicola (Kurisakia onigurumii)]|uniref:dUTP diphosphatase n=1 Tax=Buchnera aphidicola TaxID=9 RepID=UPI0031B6BFEB
MKKKIDVKIIDPRIGKEFPFLKYETTGSSALDLRACCKKMEILKYKETILIPTGVSIYISDPLITGMVFPRSGLSHKYGIILSNSIGLIDSDYQGELMLSIYNRNKNFSFFIKPGMRIAQISFFNIIRPVFNIVSDFKDSNSERGICGFGHTGYL